MIAKAEKYIHSIWGEADIPTHVSHLPTPSKKLVAIG
jgi:hypothetical protein